jgi:hypothetical protein
MADCRSSARMIASPHAALLATRLTHLGRSMTPIRTPSPKLTRPGILRWVEIGAKIS